MDKEESNYNYPLKETIHPHYLNDGVLRAVQGSGMTCPFNKLILPSEQGKVIVGLLCFYI